MAALTSFSSPKEAEELANTGLRHIVAHGPPGHGEEGPETELPVPPGQLLAGRYVVERIFAEGGMGVVCLGRHLQLEQTVAIKFLRRALANKPDVVERFLNEGRALAALRSEHVVRVMDVGQLDSGRPYLVMEHLEGIDLDALVTRDGPLDPETAVDFALQVCEPLAEAHALGIVHRDIKPENLFLWSGGPSRPIVKVLDFGLAKQFNSSRAKAVTGPQDSMGSPCYMSPEQITTPQSIDARTDVWSLGVVLHRLLTDTVPFDGNSIMEVLSHVLSAPPKFLDEARPGQSFDSELQSIVNRCLEKSPDARFASVEDLRQALVGYLAKRRGTMPVPGASAEPTADLAASSEPARASAEGVVAPVAALDDEPIKIPGVRSRWPFALVLLVLLSGAAAYQAERSGLIHVRAWATARLAGLRLGPDAPSAALTGSDRPMPGIARGVFAIEPTRDASGALSLRAEPEREAAPLPVLGAEPTPVDPDLVSEPLITPEERARREAAYRAYLESERLVPLKEVLAEPAAPLAEPTPPAAQPSSPPAETSTP